MNMAKGLASQILQYLLLSRRWFDMQPIPGPLTALQQGMELRTTFDLEYHIILAQRNDTEGLEQSMDPFSAPNLIPDTPECEIFLWGGCQDTWSPVDLVVLVWLHPSSCP